MERWRHQIVLLLFVSFCSVHCNLKEDSYFPKDYLTPYPGTRHGSRRIAREIAECQHVKWENRTYEELSATFPLEPTTAAARYELHRFADTVTDGVDDLRRRYLVGSIAYLEQPYYSFSVLEPDRPGGCKVQYWSTTRKTVRETSTHRFGGCRLATNAGYFDVHSGHCLGNVVSDGRVVQTSNDEQNANFGIREDGSFTVGYIPDQEILNTSNPFRQLVSGVIWLVRNGSSFVNKSMKLECSTHEDTGQMETFVNVISARTAIGHDDEGRLVIAQVNGQTHHRGANLHEFADLLIRRGVVNAINLDGGGSSTFIRDQVLINYPSDHCPGLPEYRCERPVSTILCIHDVQCIEPQCSSHGSCDLGKCLCESPWIGEGCSQLNCSLIQCFNNATCLNGVCACSAGWMGDFCNKSCPSGRYGLNCEQTCYCYGRSFCDPISGSCSCPDGYHGYGCWQECQNSYFGHNCEQKCSCSEHGTCSPVNGSCTCQAGWTGLTCNDSVIETITSSGLEEEGNYSLTRWSDSVDNTTTEASPHLTSLGETNEQGSTQRSNEHSVESETPPTKQIAPSTNYPCQQTNNLHIGVAVAMVIIAGCVSVVIHVLICLTCQKRMVKGHFETHRAKYSKLKRRKLRKKPPFMRHAVQSSSDCSI